MKQRAFEEQLARGNVPSLLLLYGDSEYTISQTVERVVSSVLKPGDRDLGLQHLDPAKLTWPELRDTIDTPPFGLFRKLVLVRDMHRLSKDFMKELFAFAAESGIPEFSVVLMTGTKVPGGMPRKKKNDRRVTAPVGVKLFPPFENQLPKILSKKASELQVKVSYRVADEIILRAGTDLAHLQRELEKLAVYIHPRTTVEIDDVRQACSGARENIFALVDNVLDGKPAAALQALTDVLEVGGSKQPLIMILRILQKRFRMVMQARGLIIRLPDNSRTMVKLAHEHKQYEHRVDFQANMASRKLAAKAETIKKAMRETMEAGDNPLPEDKKANLLKQHARVVLSCFYHASRLSDRRLADALIATARAESMSRDGATTAEACLDQLIITLSGICGGAGRSGYAEGNAS